MYLLALRPRDKFIYWYIQVYGPNNSNEETSEILKKVSVILFRVSEELPLILTKDLWVFDVQVTAHRDKFL